MPATCLVTGVAGFIGSGLAQALLLRGHRVVGIDMLDGNYDARIKEWNLKGMEGRKGFRWIRGDLLEQDLGALLEGVDVVFHLAARPGVRDSWGDAYNTYNRQNVLATQRLLEACGAKPPKRFVYASSSSVYGEMPGRPVREEDSTRPISPYGVTKLAAEHLVFAYQRTRDLPAVSLRYFTVYGPRQRPDMAFHRFLRAILTGGELVIFGDGSQTRDVTFVEEVVAANLAAMERGSPGSIYNIGGGHRVGINDALKVMEDVTGRKAKVRFQKRPAGDPINTGANITKAKKELGFKPATSLEEGIRRMAGWMQECLDRGL
jgi:UDP-glucose 4-epimerase